jgi:molybdopterin-guanine dinucleotide biosynthesis protein A
MITDVTGVLLAGGKSRRMGEDKRFIRVGQETLFDRSLTVLREVFEAVCVVIAQDSPPLQADVPVVRDLIPDSGSLGGLYTGLRLAKGKRLHASPAHLARQVPDKKYQEQNRRQKGRKSDKPELEAAFALDVYRDFT